MALETIGDKNSFAIGYGFDDPHETELEMYVDNFNILSFKRDGLELTTKWDLDELALWLRNFVNSMSDDPYPVDVPGEYAAIKDINAREFDSDDIDLFDAYYDRLDAWNLRHRWHPASSGAILADLYFQVIGDNVEISWNNTDAEDGVTFNMILGGTVIKKDTFVSVINDFLKAYALHWFN